MESGMGGGQWGFRQASEPAIKGIRAPMGPAFPLLIVETYEGMPKPPPPPPAPPPRALPVKPPLPLPSIPDPALQAPRGRRGLRAPTHA